VLQAHLSNSARPQSPVLQGWAGERILVDKTPPYVWSLDTLRRAEAIFEDARYIFLHRHPYAAVASVAKLANHGEWISGGLDGLSARDSTAVDAAAATHSTILAAVEEAEFAAAAASGAGAGAGDAAGAAPASPSRGGDSDAEAEVGQSE